MGSALGDNGTTPEWRRIRARILKRDGYTCRYCGGRANSVDHIIPRAAWPADAPGVDADANLTASCKPCNSKKGSKINPPQLGPKPRTSREW